MKFTAISYSTEGPHVSFEDWAQNLAAEINIFIKQESRIIIYPELFLLTLADKEGDLLTISKLIEDKLLPYLCNKINSSGTLICLGSFPRFARGKLYNSSPLFFNNKWYFQDKINLTPWENDFSPGSEIHIFNFHGLKLTTLICFDIEQLTLAKLLKDEGIEILLVPSATSNKNGNDRINRCASARAIELGAVVLTTPIVGESSNYLIDHNEGRQGFFLPAQDEIYGEQMQYSGYSTGEKIVKTYECDMDKIKNLKIKTDETKPFLHHEVLGVKFIYNH